MAIYPPVPIQSQSEKQSQYLWKEGGILVLNSLPLTWHASHSLGISIGIGIGIGISRLAPFPPFFLVFFFPLFFLERERENGRINQ
jgi:hypothetical protein